MNIDDLADDLLLKKKGGIWIPPKDGLVFYEPFNKQREKTLVGAITIPSGAVISDVDGRKCVRSYVSLAVPFPSETDPVTMGEWIYFTNMTYAFMGFWNSQHQGKSFFITTQNSYGTISSYPGGINYSINMNKWYHVVYIHTGSKIQMYINGVFYREEDSTLNKIPTGTTEICPQPYSGSGFTAVSDAFFYSRTLTSSEVNLIYEKTMKQR